MQNKNHIYTLLAVGVLAAVFYGFYSLRMDSTLPPAPANEAMTAQPEITGAATPQKPVVEAEQAAISMPEENAARVNVQDMTHENGHVPSIMEQQPHAHDTEVPAAEMLKIRAAAEKGDPQAQGALGEMYHQGSGVERDLRKAFYWFRKGAEGGDGSSMIYLGRYYNGEFPELGIRDLNAAEKWLQKQAIAGDQYAMTLLGQVLYAKVREGHTDRHREASWWYNRGTGGGVDESYTPPALRAAQTAEDTTAPGE